MFEPIGNTRTHLYDKVVQQIKTAILEGDLKPGDKLPPERELADILGVSRTIIREATKILAAMDMLKIKHGHGIFVTTNNFKEMSLTYQPRETTLKELFEVRKLIEPQCAYWAAERSPQELIDKLVENINMVEQGLNTSRSGKLLFLGEHDSRFHMTMARASGNNILLKLMDSLADQMAESQTRAWSVPGRPMRSFSEHKRVIEAIVAKKPQEAAAAMLSHLENVEREIL